MPSLPPSEPDAPAIDEAALTQAREMATTLVSDVVTATRIAERVDAACLIQADLLFDAYRDINTLLKEGKLNPNAATTGAKELSCKLKAGYNDARDLREAQRGHRGNTHTTESSTTLTTRKSSTSPSKHTSIISRRTVWTSGMRKATVLKNDDK